MCIIRLLTGGVAADSLARESVSDTALYHQWRNCSKARQIQECLVDTLDDREEFEAWFQSRQEAIADLPELPLPTCVSEQVKTSCICFLPLDANAS